MMDYKDLPDDRESIILSKVRFYENKPPIVDDLRDYEKEPDYVHFCLFSDSIWCSVFRDVTTGALKATIQIAPNSKGYKFIDIFKAMDNTQNKIGQQNGIRSIKFYDQVFFHFCGEEVIPANWGGFSLVFEYDGEHDRGLYQEATEEFKYYTNMRTLCSTIYNIAKAFNSLILEEKTKKKKNISSLIVWCLAQISDDSYFISIANDLIKKIGNEEISLYWNENDKRLIVINKDEEDEEDDE